MFSFLKKFKIQLRNIIQSSGVNSLKEGNTEKHRKTQEEQRRGAERAAQLAALQPGGKGKGGKGGKDTPSTPAPPAPPGLPHPGKMNQCQLTAARINDLVQKQFEGDMFEQWVHQVQPARDRRGGRGARAHEESALGKIPRSQEEEEKSGDGTSCGLFVTQDDFS